ncbi:hypothetical protein [Bacillus sp. JCM 19041]|uniref:hypothetical protein n=1 Tax=Bacillus sp. JCM 19041 TaxID=1460637 RepID=UPI00336A6C4A
MNVQYYIDLAKQAEAGLFDMVFFADQYSDRKEAGEDVSAQMTARLIHCSY